MYNRARPCPTIKPIIFVGGLGENMLREMQKEAGDGRTKFQAGLLSAGRGEHLLHVGIIGRQGGALEQLCSFIPDKAGNY